MMIQEIKQGMKVRNAGGDVFEIMGTKGNLVIVKMLENHSNGWKVNCIHQTFIPGKVLEIDQTAELVTAEGYYEVALEYLEPVEEAEELEIPMFNQGDYVKDKFGNIFKIVAVVAPQHFEQGSDEYDNMGYRLELIDKDPNSPLREVGEGSGAFYRQGDMLWIFNTKEDIKAEGYKVTPAHITATELVIFEESEDAKESEIPMFKLGDYVKDKFGNVFEVVETKEPSAFIRGCDYQPFGYRLKLVSKAIGHPNPKIYDDLEFIKLGDTYWIYNTVEDIRPDEYSGTLEHHIFAADLVIFEEAETAETTEEIEESDIPILFEGDLVKDAFGNTFEVVEAKPRQRLDPDRFDYCNMGYRLKLVTKNPTSPIREVHDNVKFLEEGNKYWVYNREEDARNVKKFNHTITASELVLSKSVFQVELRKTLESATPAKAESAKHRPSIQELRKLSEEYNPENLLDEAYQILEEQARLGERRANLTGKFKNCIQHFKREGFNVLEHGMLIEISW